MPERLGALLRFWFTFEEPVDRRRYLLHGVGLMVGKYAVDAAVVLLVTGRFWSPLDYVNPVWTARQAQLARPAWLMLVIALWTLPFLWIGVSMTMRRAVNAGHSAWLSLLFFVPFANYLVMLWLATAQSGLRVPQYQRAEQEVPDAKLRDALIAMGAGLAVAIPTVLLSVLVVKSYSTPLFLGTPFSLGAIGAYVLNRDQVRTLGYTLQVTLAGLVLLAGAIILFAVEGLVCVLMALPIAGAVALIGAVLGRALARFSPGAAPVGPGAMLAIALPVLTVVDALPSPPPPIPLPPRLEHRVVTAVAIDAPPAVVWRNVVSFADLPEPTGWLFHTGIAYPKRARIEGAGVGAVRYCEFSTGAFVEPITAWEAPRRLAFAIVEQPAPMAELSPYPRVRAAHLNGYFQATNGEFELVELPGGRTRLVGTTAYQVRMYPQWYWSVFADAIVERIHGRVLEHIERLSEQER
ncbi:MAG: DUF805 domain-containing protein [Gemmatimonadales bacterium]